MKSLRFHPLVHRDLADALSHYADISPALETRFWNEVQLALSKIQEMPERHHIDQYTVERVCNPFCKAHGY